MKMTFKIIFAYLIGNIQSFPFGIQHFSPKMIHIKVKRFFILRILNN